MYRSIIELKTNSLGKQDLISRFELVALRCARAPNGAQTCHVICDVTWGDEVFGSPHRNWPIRNGASFWTFLSAKFNEFSHEKKILNFSTVNNPFVCKGVCEEYVCVYVCELYTPNIQSTKFALHLIKN